MSYFSWLRLLIDLSTIRGNELKASPTLCQVWHFSSTFSAFLIHGVVDRNGGSHRSNEKAQTKRKEATCTWQDTCSQILRRGQGLKDAWQQNLPEMVSKCFKCELLHLLWEEPTGEETAYCQSLQLEDNRIINKINPILSLPVHFWSTFKRSDFQSAGEYHYLDKLLDKAGVLVKTDQMLTEKWNTEDTQQGETKASFCLQTRESALPDPIDRTYLPRQLSCFFDQQRDKGF